MPRTLSTKHSDALTTGPAQAPITLVQFQLNSGTSYQTTHNENVTYNGDTYIASMLSVAQLSQDSAQRGGTARINWPCHESSILAVVRAEDFLRSTVLIYKTVAFETLVLADAELVLSGVVNSRTLSNGVANIDIISTNDYETYPVDFITEEEGWPYVGKEGTYNVGGRTFIDVLA